MYEALTMSLIQEGISEFTKNGRLSTCLLPVQIRNVLNSLACHSKIKFLLSLKMLSVNTIVYFSLLQMPLGLAMSYRSHNVPNL